MFKDALTSGRARLVALCDVDPKRVAAGKLAFEKALSDSAQTVTTYTDLRRLIESK